MSSLDEFLDDYQEWLFNDYGFFKPYQNVKDFKYTLISPIFAPVVYGLTSCLYLSASLLSLMLVIPVGIGAAIVGQCFNDTQMVQNAMDSMFSAARSFYKNSLYYLGVALLSIVGAPIGLVTRTIVTLCDAVNNLYGCSETSDLTMSL